MLIAQKLLQALATPQHLMGEVLIETNAANNRFILFHEADLALAGSSSFGGLMVYDGPGAAREIASYAQDGSYRFLKGQLNLRRGWVMRLACVEDLRLALDQFYPACVGLWLAQQDGTLEVTHLRDTLQRQSGMYRRAQALSDAALQSLVPGTCAAAIPCARRILWQLDAHTPLLPSPASRCNGTPNDGTPSAAIPLLCREACNHFVAQCLAAATAKTAAAPQVG